MSQGNGRNRFAVVASLIYHGLKENLFVLDLILLVLLLIGYLNRILHRNRSAFSLFSQVHRSTRRKRLRLLVEPFIVRHLPYASEKFDLPPTVKLEQYFGNRLMVLKAPGPSSEKGVLLVMFSELFTALTRQFSMEALLRDYRLVLEPSWSGYCSDEILQFTVFNNDVYILSPEAGDYEFIKRLRTNLKPLPYGPSDWVNPSLYDQGRGSIVEKKYDLVMNSHWGWSKRHHVLFSSLRKLSRDIKVALIGVPWEGRTMDDIKDLAKYFGVEKQLTFYQRIPYLEVMKVTAESKMGILLSLKEGSNRALAECLFCDVPVILLKEHVGGVNKVINSKTGMHATSHELAEAIMHLRNNPGLYQPRKWALENISCLVTTEKLNAFLKESALDAGEPWTQDIVARASSPESRYFDPEDEVRFRKLNRDLSQYCKH